MCHWLTLNLLPQMSGIGGPFLNGTHRKQQESKYYSGHHVGSNVFTQPGCLLWLQSGQRKVFSPHSSHHLCHSLTRCRPSRESNGAPLQLRSLRLPKPAQCMSEAGQLGHEKRHIVQTCEQRPQHGQRRICTKSRCKDCSACEQRKSNQTGSNVSALSK